MKKKNKKFKGFEEFFSSKTESYPPPEHVIEPAKDDKGFALVKKAFGKMKKIYQSEIKQ